MTLSERGGRYQISDMLCEVLIHVRGSWQMVNICKIMDEDYYYYLPSPSDSILCDFHTNMLGSHGGDGDNVSQNIHLLSFPFHSCIKCDCPI